MTRDGPASPVVVTWLRHGSVAGRANVLRGTADEALSESGRRELQAALARLNGRYERVICSPRRRCADFAVEFAREQALPLTPLAELAEMDFGAWEGLSAAEIRARDGDAYERFRADPHSLCPPGGESWAAFSARVALGIEQAALGSGPVLALTHAGVIRAVLAQALNIAPGDASRIALAPAAWARVSYLAGQPPVLLELQSHC